MACEINDECCSECEMMCPCDVEEINMRYNHLKEELESIHEALEFKQKELDEYRDEYREVIL